MNDWLARRANLTPDFTALVFEQQEWSFSALNTDVTQFSNQLMEQGIQANDHIGVLLPNVPAYIILIHACARIGAVLVPLNLMLHANELEWQIQQ
ncbi:MAG: acyl--CoA ligase, partial [Chloroflexota bacterium]